MDASEALDGPAVSPSRPSRYAGRFNLENFLSVGFYQQFYNSWTLCHKLT